MTFKRCDYCGKEIMRANHIAFEGTSGCKVQYDLCENCYRAEEERKNKITNEVTSKIDKALEGI